jgi:hypothetical protein
MRRAARVEKSLAKRVMVMLLSPLPQDDPIDTEGETAWQIEGIKTR